MEDLALSFGGSKRFEDMNLGLFSRLDLKLQAQADLEDVARELITRAMDGI